uniref:SnoaL-like domain-containing protein n=1 Tax=Cyanothece sp. (strain PCC 7425 / ATCC 29141) TaxID=395961 RepID=B8HMI6_CYAP4
MDIVSILRQDYQRFPQDQTYEIYAADVYFRDPLTQFRGIKRYQNMIQFIQTWFINTRMELHEIQQQEQQITTRWTLSWIAPLPWHPQLSISGRSELTLNQAGLIVSHLDYWDCSRWEVLQQLFRR